MITQKDIVKIVRDIFFGNNSMKETIVVLQGCKTNGMVRRSNIELNLCDDSECSSCREIQNTMEEISKNLKTDEDV